MGQSTDYSHNILPLKEEHKGKAALKKAQSLPYYPQGTKLHRVYVEISQETDKSWSAYHINDYDGQQTSDQILTKATLDQALYEASKFEKSCISMNRKCDYLSILDFHLEVTDANHFYYLANQYGRRLNPSGDVQPIDQSFQHILQADALALLQDPLYSASLAQYLNRSLPDVIDIILPSQMTPDHREAAFANMLHHGHGKEALNFVRSQRGFFEHHPQQAFHALEIFLNDKTLLADFLTQVPDLTNLFLSGWQQQMHLLPPLNEHKSSALPLEKCMLGKYAETMDAENFQWLLDQGVAPNGLLTCQNTALICAYQANRIDNFNAMVQAGAFKLSHSLNGEMLLYTDFILKTVEDGKLWATKALIEDSPEYLTHLIGDASKHPLIPLGIEILLQKNTENLAPFIFQQQDIISWRSHFGDTAVDLLYRAGKEELLKTLPNYDTLFEHSSLAQEQQRSSSKTSAQKPRQVRQHNPLTPKAPF